jgi:GAF domain-containing protein
MRLLNLINPYYLSPTVRKKDPLSIQREIILQFLLDGITLFGILGLVQYLLRENITLRNLSLVIPFAISIGVQLAITLARPLPYRLRATSLALLILLEALTTLFREGLSGNGAAYGLAFVAIVAALFNPRSGFFAGALYVLIHSLCGWGMVTGRITLPTLEVMANSGQPTAWLSSGMALLLVASSISAAIFLLTRGLSSALDNQKQLTTQLSLERDSLEDRVEERTRELARKASQLAAAQQVAAELASESDLNRLLTTAVDVIKEQFGFYHAGIFINDTDNTYAILEASTGSAGRAMLASGHRLRIGEVGIVGYVASRGEPRVTSDVRADPNYYPNPNLPETRAEMAVPLRFGEKTIGVLDIQSTIQDAFSPDDLEMISTIANQISLALEKARLMRDLENSLADLEVSARQSTARTWDAHIRSSRRRYAYQYKRSTVTAGAVETQETASAVNEGVTIVTPAQETGSNESVIAVPIKLRGQPVGVINLRVASAKVSPEMIQLVENAVNRLAISLENVRLLEELQVRAERERMVGEISARVRSATDVDTILRTAAGELGRSLGVTEVIVQLNPGK